MDTDFDLESLINVEQTCVFTHLELPKYFYSIILQIHASCILDFDLTFTLFSNVDSTTKGTKMGSHMAVSTGSSKAELSEERRV